MSFLGYNPEPNEVSPSKFRKAVAVVVSWGEWLVVHVASWRYWFATIVVVVVVVSWGKWFIAMVVVVVVVHDVSWY